MISSQNERLVYRELEKFYRITGYYEGQEIMPLDQAEAHIQSNLEESLRGGDEYIRRLSYRLHMAEVICEGNSVFQTDKPELSLVYSLFSEGIQSLILLRDLSSQDIKEWLEVVRRTIQEFESGGMKDLASVLWRNPSRNIRTRIYNSLSDLEAKATQARAAEKKSEAISGKPEEAVQSWHHRDQEWDTPEAVNVQRLASAQAPIAADKIKRAREASKGVELNFELPPDLQLESSEVLTLTQELSFFDQNHVDFNLLNWQLAAMNQHQQLNRDSRESVVKQIMTLTEGVISRFQPSLIFLLLHEVNHLPKDLAQLRADILGMITKTLRHPANEKRLLSSLRDPQRAQVTKRLFPYLDAKQFSAVVDFFLKFNDRDGLVEFLKVVLENRTDTSNLLFSWGDQRLCQILPLFRRLHWTEKYDFLKRCLRSTSKSLAKQACYYIYNIPFETETALKTYSLLSDESKEIWMKALIENPVKDSWNPFLKAMFMTGQWRSAESKIMSSRLMMGWVDIVLKYFREAALVLMEECIRSRTAWFWPTYPELREICLLGIIRERSLRKNETVMKLLKREARVIFQTPELKEQLAIAVRSMGEQDG